jgi:hypothetical protein
MRFGTVRTTRVARLRRRLRTKQILPSRRRWRASGVEVLRGARPASGAALGLDSTLATPWTESTRARAPRASDRRWPVSCNSTRAIDQIEKGHNLQAVEFHVHEVNAALGVVRGAEAVTPDMLLPS